MYLQLAIQSVHHLTGIAKDIPVKIRNFFVPVDFVILDIEVDTKIPLILGRPFLTMTIAHIDAGVGVIQLDINGQKRRLGFKPKGISERAREVVFPHRIRGESSKSRGD